MTVDVCILCSAGSELNVVLGPIYNEMINSILGSEGPRFVSRSYKSVLTLALRDSDVLTGVVWKNTGTDTIYPSF